MKKGILYALITAIVFVTLEPVSKLIANDVNPYAITFWRFLIGSVILLPPAIIKVKKENIHITAIDWIKMVLLGILFISLSMVVLQIAVKKAEAPSLIAIIFSANSVFTILLAILINKEKINKNKTIALILGVAGVVLCADFKSGANLESVMLAVIAALTFSLYTVISQRYTKKLSGIIQSSMVFLSGSIILLIALLIMGVDVSVKLEPKTLSILGYLGVFVTGIGYAAYFKAIEKGGAIMASFAFFIKPILTPFVTWIVNGIVPDFKVFVSIMCIMGASYFAIYRKQKQK